MIKAIVSDFSRVALNPKDINYKGSLNSLYKEHKEKPGFNFFNFFELNEEILGFYKSLKDRVSVNLFTTDIIQNDPAVKIILEDVFDNIFSAKDFGLDKKNPAAYSFIAQKLNISTSETLYIDDQVENIEAARKSGLSVWHYSNPQELMDQVKNQLNLE